MRFLFEWDPRKAESNVAKHRVSFDDVTSIFLDPRALTIFDEENSDDEDRWVTMGEATGQKLLLIVHTHVEISAEEVRIRIISARRPTKRETAQYRETTGQ